MYTHNNNTLVQYCTFYMCILTCVFRTTLLLLAGHQIGTCSDLVDAVPIVSERICTADNITHRQTGKHTQTHTHTPHTHTHTHTHTHIHTRHSVKMYTGKERNSLSERWMDRYSQKVDGDSLVNHG